VLTAYLLAASVATPIVAALGDMFGKRRIMLLALGGLAAGTLLAALATTLPLLITARAVQGVGGAVLPLSIGIARDELPPGRVGVTVGLLSAIFGIGAGLGIVLAPTPPKSGATRRAPTARTAGSRSRPAPPTPTPRFPLDPLPRSTTAAAPSSRCPAAPTPPSPAPTPPAARTTRDETRHLPPQRGRRGQRQHPVPQQAPWPDHRTTPTRKHPPCAARKAALISPATPAPPASRRAGPRAR
jgi:Major Facilitator Superfamily